jgi:hypothetical protein
LFRRQLQQLAARAVGQDVDTTVLKDAHVADPLVEIREQRFPVDDLVVLAQLETKNRLSGQAAHENAVLPLWEEVAPIVRPTRTARGRGRCIHALGIGSAA